MFMFCLESLQNHCGCHHANWKIHCTAVMTSSGVEWRYFSLIAGAAFCWKKVIP